MSNTIIDVFSISSPDEMKVEIEKTKISDTVYIYLFTLNWTLSNSKNDDSFEISWEEPLNDILYQ